MHTYLLNNELKHLVKGQRQQSDALIEVIHAAQEKFGYLTSELLGQLAEQLQLPPSLVYGVASFYHAFRLEPRGEHHCTVCTGTSCHVRGSTALLRKLEQAFGISCGETAADGSISLDTVRCLGVCGLAPLAVFDGQIIRADSPSEMIDKVILALENKSTP